MAIMPSGKSKLVIDGIEFGEIEFIDPVPSENTFETSKPIMDVCFTFTFNLAWPFNQSWAWQLFTDTEMN